MNNVLEMYKSLFTLYIYRFGVLELISNVVVVFGFLVIYLRVYRNFKDAKKQKNLEMKKTKSIVETFSMTAFFVLCALVVLFRFGRIEINVNIDILKVISILIYLFGVFVNLYGRKCLGKNWGNNVVIYVDHKLINEGIYRYIRHPLYASIIWMLYAVSVMYQNILLVALVTIIFIPFMYYRAKQEEIELEKTFKNEYIVYKKKVGMFFPKIIK